jgi:hypothetical protein
MFERAPSIPVLLFACHRLGFSLHAQRNYEHFDKTAIPLKNFLSQELLHIAFSPLASPQVPRALSQRAPSVPVLLFAYDHWGSHSMSNATTKTLTERLYR